jgi:hypothetical protein
MADKKTQHKTAVIKAYKNLFNSPEGMLVLGDLMQSHGMMSPSFRGDVNQAIFKEGERNVVLRILAILKVDETQLRERMEQYAREQNS